MNSSDINMNTVKPVTIWSIDYELINKKEKLNEKEEKEIRKMNRRHLKWFHWYRHEKRKNPNFDSIDYSRWSFDDLVKEGCKAKDWFWR
tara:strand:- start:81 stop:347 length:267 start_codon:yes stop_codon:yes gene_type:complete